MNRRKFMLAAAAAQLAASFATLPVLAATPAGRRIRQGVMPTVWRGTNLTLEQRCQTLARIGYVSMDLPSAADVEVMKKYGLTPSVMTGGTGGSSFQNGMIRKELHDSFEKPTRDGIDLCARVGCPNLFLFPGERRGMSREEAADNTVAFFNRFKGYAEQKGVTLSMENTNAKVVADQRTDQAFDHVAWGFDICKRVNSPNVKVVYDIYHAQVSDGDIARTLRDEIAWICHIHVAGAPGRLEIDDTQELNYRFLANVIAETGYKGVVAHEWRLSPGHETVATLEQCFKIMDV
jgi:hydroxypyruvate isomerase